ASTWGVVEGHVDGIVAAYIAHDQQVRAIPAVDNLLVKYASLDPVGQIDAVVRHLVDPKGRSMIDVHAAQLDTIGWPPREAPDAATRERLEDLEQLRHVAEHRNGHADARLLAKRPALPYVVGDDIPFDEAMVREFLDLARGYVDGI